VVTCADFDTKNPVVLRASTVAAKDLKKVKENGLKTAARFEDVVNM
jgi:hypothetical protein